MTAPAETPTPAAAPAPAASQERVFLVVVDESDELRVALRYAGRRAQHTGGRVALLYVNEPTELQHWMSVETLMREERREEAEALLQRLSAKVAEIARTMPVIYIREGRRRDELLALIEEEQSISILVLAASAATDGPGPLITALTGKYMQKLRIPLTVVPGTLTDAQIDALT